MFSERSFHKHFGNPNTVLFQTVLTCRLLQGPLHSVLEAFTSSAIYYSV